MGITNYTTFLIASFLFIISPGIDTMFVLNKTISQGRRSGLLATLGIITGVMVHTTLAAFGLSLLLAQSAMLFTFVKYLGAAYLIWLGVTKFFSKDTIVNDDVLPPVQTAKNTYLSAVITDVLNPKVAIFFLAFFPQFIQPAYIHSALPFIILGCIYAVLSLFWFIILTFFAGLFSSKLKQTPAYANWLNKFSSVAFVLMGIKVAFTKR